MLPMKTRDQLYRHEPKPRNAAVAPCRRDAASRHRYRYRLFVKPLNFTAVRCYEKKGFDSNGKSAQKDATAATRTPKLCCIVFLVNRTAN